MVQLQEVLAGPEPTILFDYDYATNGQFPVPLVCTATWLYRVPWLTNIVPCQEQNTAIHERHVMKDIGGHPGITFIPNPIVEGGKPRLDLCTELPSPKNVASP